MKVGQPRLATSGGPTIAGYRGAYPLVTLVQLHFGIILRADYKHETGYCLSLNLPRVSWQKNFHDLAVRRSEDLTAHVRYILDSPYRKAPASE